MTIDIHAHIVPPSVIAAGRNGSELHGIRFERTAEGRLRSSCGDQSSMLPWPRHDESLEDRLAYMDRVGVDVHVLSLSPSVFWYQSDPAQATQFARVVNDELAAIVDQHPTRFAAFAYLALQEPRESARELSRCMGDLGMAGAIVGTNIDGRDWDDPALLPVLEVAEETQALLFVHPARVRMASILGRYHLRNLIGNPLETTITVASLIFGGVLDRFPDLRLCLAHGGGYGCLGVGRFDHGYRVRPEAGQAQQPPSDYLRRLMVDSLVHDPLTLRTVIDRVGAGNVVLGTDYPADMGQPDPVDWVREAPDLTDEEKDAILTGNAARVLGDRLARVTS